MNKLLKQIITEVDQQIESIKLGYIPHISMVDGKVFFDESDMREYAVIESRPTASKASQCAIR